MIYCLLLLLFIFLYPISFLYSNEIVIDIVEISKYIVCRLIDSLILVSMSIAQFIDATASNDVEVQFFSIDENKTSFIFERVKEKYGTFLEIILRYLKTANNYKKNSKCKLVFVISFVNYNYYKWIG